MKPPAARGASAEGHVDRLLSAASVMERGRFAWHQLHPPIRGGVRAKSGLPDRAAYHNGQAFMFEVKEKNGTSIEVGLLTGENTDCGGGIRPGQTTKMDLMTDAGVRCFVVAVLIVAAKAAKRRKDGTVSDPGYPGATIARIIPWATWRALMQAAEDQRQALARWQIESGRLMVRNGHTCALPPKPTVDASISAADLAEMGSPCRTAAELLAAIRGC